MGDVKEDESQCSPMSMCYVLDPRPGLDPVSDPPDPEPPPDAENRRNRNIVINSLNRRALYQLWHQRLGHLNYRRLSELHKHVKGVPKLPMVDETVQCPICIQAKMHKADITGAFQTTPTAPNQVISVDFGFIVQKSKDTERLNELKGLNGETCYVLITDHYSGRLYGTPCKDKRPPLDFLRDWLSVNRSGAPDRAVILDPGGDLGGCSAVLKLFKEFGYNPLITGENASYQNGMGERPHRTIGNAIRAMLTGGGLAGKFWPFAFRYYLRMHNLVPHGNRPKSPYEMSTAHAPKGGHLMRTFGSRIYVHKERDSALDSACKVLSLIHI